jgi:metalloendopeptidase OMA1, mitochondrial
LLEAFKGNLLPQNHPITVEVTRVVSRILESSNLGTVKGGDTSFTMPGGSDADGWSWDADAGMRTADPAPGTGTKEWMVLVVNDPKVVNAMASFGEFFIVILVLSFHDVAVGTIVVFTGILPICRDDQGVASVLGHGRLISCFRCISHPCYSQRLGMSVGGAI